MTAISFDSCVDGSKVLNVFDKRKLNERTHLLSVTALLWLFNKMPYLSDTDLRTAFAWATNVVFVRTDACTVRTC